MPATRFPLLALLLVALLMCGSVRAVRGWAEEKNSVADWLARPILEPRQVQLEWQEYLDRRIPRMPDVKTIDEWEKHAARLRKDLLDKVVFRGEAAAWRELKTRVEWLGDMAGGPGYRIKKLRYEAVPGLWIPALLYEPEKPAGKMALSLALNGHDRNGKAAAYKQMLCINMARRGMLVLNVEWLGMGQLKGPGFNHGSMNQLDLCGTSGLAPFYLAMSRGLDVLLSHPQADSRRVVVSGLSGGGWQTIFLSSLDQRVTLANPVAGYSSFRTQIAMNKDTGDSEQTPCDLALFADYKNLTALMAPRPTLLTYNAKDDCCFEAGYSLPPLLNAAEPIFKLYGKEKALRSHINEVPGTHNFEKDNRQALYRMLGDFFFPLDRDYQADEVPAPAEIKTSEQMTVEMPEKNANFQSLALGLASNLPHDGKLPEEEGKVLQWQEAARQKLHKLVKAGDYAVRAKRLRQAEKAGVKATFWQLQLADAWTVPVVELTPGKHDETVILLNDSGRKTDAATVERWLGLGYRVLAVDLTTFGETNTGNRDWLFGLLLHSTGERLLGLQASQLLGIAGWSQTVHGRRPVTIVATGPRLCMAALTAAALGPDRIGRVELFGSLASLKELIEQNRDVSQSPELFCFGLLEHFDVEQLAALVAPRAVVFHQPTNRVRKEMGNLKRWYQRHGVRFDPLLAETP
jgi:hypothetical protein